MNRAVYQPLTATPVVTSSAPHRGEMNLGAADFFSALRRHALALALWVVTCTVLGAVWVAVTPSEYIATTMILLEPHRAHTPAADAGVSVQPALDTAAADSQIQVLKSERLLRFVFDSLGLERSDEFSARKVDFRALLYWLPQPVADLVGRWRQSAATPDTENGELRFLKFMNSVAVRRLGQSYVLELSYSASTGDLAARRANSIAMAYIHDQIEERAATASQGDELLQTRIADIARESQEAMDAVKLGFVPSARFPDADARVISSAIVPLHRAFPQLGLTLAFSATLGMFSGLCLIFFRLGSDTALRTRAQIVAATGLECLACLPYDRKGAARLTRGDATSDAFVIDPTLRALMAARASVLSALPTSSGVSLGIVSVRPGEGKTSIASGLARILASSKSRVVLIDGNFLNPTLTADASRSASLSLNSAVGRGAGMGAALEVGDGVTLIPAFLPTERPDHSLYLGGLGMREFLDSLRPNNVVIIEAPATSLSSDTLALAPLLDGVILVVEAGRTTEAEVKDVVAALSIRTRLLGVILNKVPR